MDGDGHNVELKLPLDSAEDVEAALRRLGAVNAGTLVQRDTYFRVVAGRLKLRETPAGAELIAYHRDERQAAMHARYTRSPVDQPAVLLRRLSDKHGIRGVVEKTRALWLYRTARIHIDHVAGLGSFLEIEVVDPRTLQQGQALLREIAAALALDLDNALTRSYIDLMETTTGAGH